MRFTALLTTAALAIAAPAFAQTTPATPGRTPLPTAPTTPDPVGDTSVPAQTPATTPAPAAMPASPATPAMPDAAAPANPAATGDAAPAAPVTPIPPTVGATVYGAAGTPVGTIKAMDSQYVTLATDKGEVRLPVAGIGPGLRGPVIGLTAEQLDAAVTQASAAQQPATPARTTRRATRRR